MKKKYPVVKNITRKAIVNPQKAVIEKRKKMETKKYKQYAK